MNDNEKRELKRFIRAELRENIAILYWEIAKLPVTYERSVKIYKGILNGDRYPNID